MQVDLLRAHPYTPLRQRQTDLVMLLCHLVLREHRRTRNEQRVQPELTQFVGQCPHQDMRQ